MSRWTLTMTGQRDTETLALRADMAAQLVEAGGLIPGGPKWTLRDGERIVGLGGLTPKGAGASLGWLLVGDDLTPRDWAMGRRAMASVLEWARSHAIRRVGAMAATAGAADLLRGLGFRPTATDGEEITMTLELT